MLSMHIVQYNYNPELEHNIQNICTSLTGYPYLITDVHFLQKNYFKQNHDGPYKIVDKFPLAHILL